MAAVGRRKSSGATYAALAASAGVLGLFLGALPMLNSPAAAAVVPIAMVALGAALSFYQAEQDERATVRDLLQPPPPANKITLAAGWVLAIAVAVATVVGYGSGLSADLPLGAVIATLAVVGAVAGHFVAYAFKLRQLEDKVLSLQEAGHTPDEILAAFPQRKP